MSPGQGLETGLDDTSPTQKTLIGNRQLITDMRKEVIQPLSSFSACIRPQS